MTSQDDFSYHSNAYVVACKYQRIAAQRYSEFVRDGIPLFGEPYRIEVERLAKEIWIHLDWLRENGYDKANKPKASAK